VRASDNGNRVKAVNLYSATLLNYKRPLEPLVLVVISLV
jgi:hypothetical protein